MICVVGGGAAGLASAAVLRRAGHDVVVLERGDVGAAWQARYDCLHLHTVRWLSGLPGYRIPRSYGKWPSRDRVVEYLRAYASKHSLDVRTGVAVERVDRDGDGWVVMADGERDHGRSASSSRPATATSPTCPTGRDRSPATSCTPRTTAAATRTAAGGCSSSAPGNSGAEIAIDVARAGASEVHLSVRTPPAVVRRDTLGVPSQLLGIASTHLPVGVGRPDRGDAPSRRVR